MRRLAATVFGLTIGCGVLGSSAPPSPPSDGLGPFALPTALEICNGSERWVATPGSAAGFCVPMSAPSPTCASSATCLAREQCVCGRCTVPVCAVDSECAAGETCQVASGRCSRTCADTSACPMAETCQAGVCVPPCASDTDCVHGEHCSGSGVCVALPCTSDAACGSERCDIQQVVTALREPAVVATGDPYPLALYVEVGGQAVWRAVSTDGVRFTVDPPMPVLSLAGERVGAPSITRRSDGRWVLAAAQGSDQSIVVATSTDGVSFSTPSIALTPSETWEGGVTGSPSIVWFNQTLVLAYTGSGGIGLATLRLAANGTVASTRVHDPTSGTARVLDPARVTDPVFWRAVDQVQGPDLVVTQGALRMYFAARGADASASVSAGNLQNPPIHWSVGVAVSAVGGWQFAVSPFDPILTRTESLGDTRDALEPSVLTVAGIWRVIVHGQTLTGTDEGILATPP